MLEILNRFAGEYSGVVALIAVTTTVAATLWGIYSHFNPRRPRFEIRYKVFDRERFVSRIVDNPGEAVRGHRVTPIYFVDVWNSGGEEITQDAVRSAVQIALQSASSERDVKFSSYEIQTETHPGISKFALTEIEGRLELQWANFGSSMGVRIRMELSTGSRADDIAVHGWGPRLTFRRIAALSDARGLIAWLYRSVVFAVPFAFLILGAGLAVSWLSSLSLTPLQGTLASLPIIIALVGSIVAAVFIGVGLNWAIERLFNTRSVVEKLHGSPPPARHEAPYFIERTASGEWLAEPPAG